MKRADIRALLPWRMPVKLGGSGKVKTPGVVREALGRAKNLWTDEPYLAHAIVAVLTEGDSYFGACGITTYETDEEGRQRVIVDVEKQTVEIPKVGKTWTFTEFAKSGPASFDELRDPDE